MIYRKGQRLPLNPSLAVDEEDNLLLAEIGDQLFQGRIIQSVMAVGQDRVKLGARQHMPEDPERQTGYADESHLALLLQLAQSRQRLVDNLVE